MTMDPIAYDPSKIALFNPESRPPLKMDARWSNDAVAAEASRLAYFRFESDPAAAKKIEGAFAKIGFGNIGYFDDSRAADARDQLDAQGFGVIDGNGKAMIAFRGTQADRPQDLFMDARILPTRWNGPGKVHEGFWASLHSLEAQIRDWLGKVKPTSLIVTGHSLGAAMATLLAGMNGIAPLPQLINFGSPLVGDSDFAAAFDRRGARRYVNCTDIVTRVPPLIYTHVEGLRYINHKGEIGPVTEATMFIDRHEARAEFAFRCMGRDNVLLRDLADHAPINYVSAVLGVRTGP